LTKISGNTIVCGIIGDPVKHTISPAMHNAAFTHSGLDYIYVPFHVTQEDLGEAINGLKAMHIRGLNVTIPHKVRVIPLLDEVDLLAQQIGAVNTIVNNEGVLKGYNTDGVGFLKALYENEIDPKNKNIIIVGAGGASRAISFTLASKGANIIILNRLFDLEWAVNLATDINNRYHTDIQALELKENNLSKAIATADLLVNTTSVGMSPYTENSPVESRFLKPGLLVCDIVYNPLETKLIDEAKKAGAKTQDGLGMLVWQGAMAFEYWTGQKAPVDIMREAALKALKS
jgi:shikimate dehydrogenase